MKNYENPSIFVKVTAKNSVAPFFWTRCIYIANWTKFYAPSLIVTLPKCSVTNF